MIARKEVLEVLEGYDPGRISIGVLGSHSALEVAHGAKEEGYRTVVVCQRGRESTYTRHYRNLFDEALVLDSFADVLQEENQERLRALGTLFVPSRSFSVYLGYPDIEERFLVPIMGSRAMLRTEERGEPKNQYYLLEKAGIKAPKVFRSPQEIDSLAIVKVLQKGSLERAFFFASSPEEFGRKAEERIGKGIIDGKDLQGAVIEEYVLGAKFNANFFWSPIREELDLLGFDRRIQTDLDGVLDLPAREQLELQTLSQNIEIGHYGATLRESQLEKVFEAGERFVEACRREYPPGMIGLFALQGAIDRNLDFYVFDVSPRIPGCPCVEPTSPYMEYKYMHPVGPGRRVAMEVSLARAEGRLGDIAT